MVVLVLLRGLEMLVADLSLAHVPVEVAFVARGRAGVHLHDYARKRAQKIPVVRDEHERAVVRLEELLQPVDGRQVEVVRRLVEQQEVRLGCEDSRKLGAHPPPARERRERLLELLRREAESAKCDLHASLDVVAAKVFEARLQLSVPLHLLRVGEVRLELRHLGLHLG